jgi:hypothetical protein
MRLPRSSPLAVSALLAVLLAPRLAGAVDVPGIDGHMTDPGHVLGHADKTSIEDKLSKIQQDTRIDVAGWIVDAPEAQLDELGHAAYKKWNIGNEWDNAVFFVITKNNRMHLILKDGSPELNAAESAKVTGADKPNSPMPQRLDSIADTIGEIVRKKTLVARPAGKNEPKRAAYYGAAWLALTIAAGALSWRYRRRPAAA